MMLLSTLYMQQSLGFSALEAGLAFLPLAVSAMAASLAITSIAFLLLTRLPADNGYLPVMLPAFLFGGFTFASAYVPLTSQGMTGVRDGESGLASGLFQTSNHLGGALVLALLATTAAAGGSNAGFLVAAALLALGAVAAARTLGPARSAP
jgi:hypothetical protein